MQFLCAFNVLFPFVTQTHTHTNTRIHIERIDRSSLAHIHADTILIAYRPFAAAAQQLLCNAHEKSFKEDIDPSISRR